MLLHRCKCGALIPQELRLCPDCEAKESDKMSRHMEYNLRRRNKKAAAFYVSAEWRKVRAFALSLYDSLDMYAYYVQHKIVVADMVHHITEMDDFSIGSGSIKGEQRAVKALDKWMTKNQHLQIKETTGIVKLLPIEEEKRRRNLPRPGQRGVPMLDMAGYRISRTHITIRRRVFKRARRQLIRGYRELKRDGTLRRERAQKIISYNSYIEQSDSFHLQERYHTEELLQVAHRVNGFYGQLEYQKRMEELHDLLERRCRSEAGKGNDGKSSGWRNDRQDGGQYQGIPSGRRKGSEDVPF